MWTKNDFRRIKKAFIRVCHLPKNKDLIYYAANKLRHFYYKVTKSTKVAYPSTVMLELTNHCNLACTTCPREYDYGKAMDKGRMKVDQAKRVIDELTPYIDSIGLTGMGETFLYNEIDEIVDYIKAKNQGIIISASTNAVVPNFIEKVTPLINKIDTIQVSVDGLDDVYEKIRIHSNFEQLNRNLSELASLCKNTKTDLMMNMVVTKENYHQMPLLVKYAESLGVKYIDFTLLNLASVTQVDISYYDFYQSEEFLATVKLLDEAIAQTTKVEVRGRNFTTENCFQKCPFPWSHFYICWNGYVAPCCGKSFPKELNFGNVWGSTVMDVLNSLSYRQFRRLWYKNISPSFCNKCHFIHIKPVK